METKEKLNLLSEYQSELQAIQESKQAMIDNVLTEEIKQQLADIDAEFNEKVSVVFTKIVDLILEKLSKEIT